MANTKQEIIVSSKQIRKEEHEPASEILSDGQEVQAVKPKDDSSNGIAPSESQKSAPTPPGDVRPSNGSSRPSLVQLGSGSTQHSTTNQPKRFSAVNINKKFLEKNSSASASSPTAQPAVKTGGSTLARPQAQSAISHSRLVTTKLTSTSPASSTSGAGWSRPSSVAPPNTVGTHSPGNNSPPLPTTSLGTATSTSGAPQLPHVNKVIQPQPRTAATQLGTPQKDGTASNKAAWGNIKLTPTSKRPDVRDDFPTAAEVASSLRTAKLNETREIVDPAAAASKQARLEEADTFRGLHLDPNAHHWDEMEEDDDNFLDGVIEFGDGRQYKIETIDGPPSDSPLNTTASTEPHINSKSGLDDSASIKDLTPSLPVSKEERFADDFDRSWPRSRPSPSSSRDVPLPPSQPGPPQPPSAPIVVTQDTRFPPEPSRVLFNERSNRLEPYNNSQRPGPGQYVSNRRSWQDSSLSPTEPRIPREPVSASQSHNVQLLQKSGNPEPHPRRRLSNTNTSGVLGPSPGPSNRDRDQIPKRDVPPSPRLPKDNFGPSSRDKEPYVERGRRSDMGPPPLPAHAMRNAIGDGARQLPPHLNEIPANVLARQDRRTSHDLRFGPASTESSGPTSTRLPSQSPVLSHASTARISPSVPLTPLPNLNAPELDEVRKDLMQSAAARAKQRRQQEEEEREKEKERARRKAAELEERIRATEAEKKSVQEKSEEEKLSKRQGEDEVIALIEDAIKSAQTVQDPSDSQATAELVTRNSSSRKGSSTSDASKLLSSQNQSASSAVFPAVSPAAHVESWRSKTGPVPLHPTPQLKQPMPTFVPPSHSSLNHVESLVGKQEDLEVVDFSDMGKFLGVPEGSENESQKNNEESALQVHSLSSRPMASDFFDDASHVEQSVSSTVIAKPWRQKSPQDVRDERAAASQWEPEHESVIEQPQTDVVLSAFDKVPPPSTKLPQTSTATDQHSQTLILPPQQSSTRSPRTQSFYKEPGMAALHDTMSRIKGALDKMQAGGSTKDATPVTSELESSSKGEHLPAVGRSKSSKERWIPPALRLRNFEILDITSAEPPRSPTPSQGGPVIRLPLVPQLLESINKRQLQLATKPSYQLQMDILSFDPPVEGMNSLDLSVNEVLFRKPVGGYRGKPRYRVYLPRLRSGPKVNIPHVFQTRNSTGTFGRPTIVEDSRTWRKLPQTKLDSSDNANVYHGLATTSRSPPPDTIALGVSITPVAVPEPPAPTKTDGAILAKSRVPKMPVGSSVAFYRDSRIDAVEENLKPSVNFIVNSELESKQPPQTSTPSKSQPSITVTPPNTASLSTDEPSRNTDYPLINGLKESSNSEIVPSPVLNKSDNKDPEDSSDHVSVTSPPITHHAASWARTSLAIPLKEPSARGPDPEHLKAVWSQTSNQPGSHGVNSLEGIGDDLTALPFTLQDVKSEDGGTPPPSISTVPSRMSLHDVTRAFQQVPSSSSNTSPSHRTPPLAAPPARPANYYNLPPPVAGAMRPSYPYQSPIMSHSPSPGVMYPPMLPGSPTPGRMPVNGSTTLYSQPMWMPMPAAPTPQNHPNMMRPYSTQLMPYSPGPPIYGPQPPTNMQSPQQQNGAQTSRDRRVSLMSPVMSHAGPAMYGSPVLMHAPVMPVPPNPGYMMPSGRSQARTDNSQIPIQNSQQPNHLHPQPGYNSVPPSSLFTRPTW